MANIADILNSKKIGKTPLDCTNYVTQMIHYTHLVKNKMQFYNMDKQVVADLADKIELAGGIQQPVLARKIDAEKYEILAGHKRVAAIKLLVEDRGLNQKQFVFVPVHVVSMNDAEAEYNLIATNDYPNKSDYEKMMEVVRLTEILPQLRPDCEQSKRVLRKAISSVSSICETRVGNFQKIQKDFCDEAMKAFKSGAFGINVAIKLASLSKKDQQEILALHPKKLTIRIIDKFIESKESSSKEEDSKEKERSQYDRKRYSNVADTIFSEAKVALDFNEPDSNEYIRAQILQEAIELWKKYNCK